MLYEIGFIDYRSRFHFSRLFYSSLCFCNDKFSTGGQSYHWKGCNAAQWQESVLKILYHKDTALCKKMQNIFAFCTICTKIYIKMICFFAIYSKIIIFAPTNMEQGRMILLRIAGRTTQGNAYFGKALSNLLSVKVIMSLIETCKAKYKFRLTLKVPHCFCCQQDTECRPHNADRKAA